MTGVSLFVREGVLFSEPDEYLNNVQSALDAFENQPPQLENAQQAQVSEDWPELNDRQDTQPAVQENLPEPVPLVQGNATADQNAGVPRGQETFIDVLELKDMDIQDFLKLIAKKSGLNIVAGSNTKGRVTIYLKDVTVRDAMQIVLEANDLAYVEEGNIVKIIPAQEYLLKYGYKFGEKVTTKIFQLKYANVLDMVTVLNQLKSPMGKVIFDHKSNTLVLIDTPDKVQEMENLIVRVDVPIETEVFELSYAPAKDVADKLSEVVTVNVGRIKFDERSNRIVVTDTKTKIEDIRKLVKAFDIKEKQVLIEAKIIQIILDNDHKMGVDWEAIVQDYHNLDLVTDFDVLTSTEKKGKLSIGTLSSDDYTFLIEALETVGETNILSSPSITAVNNKEAKILVGTTQPYVTTTTTTPASGPTTTAETINFIDVGVKLFVTPTIHQDDYITMKIKPEVSSVTSTLETSQNNSIPIVDTSQAETVVTVKDNVTIVIGGLIKEEKLDTIKKIPFLGDIPFFGAAFRSFNKSLTKTELVIFLTPKIITGDVEANRRLGNIQRNFATPLTRPDDHEDQEDQGNQGYLE